jgi:hypothetical protein
VLSLNFGGLGGVIVGFFFFFFSSVFLWFCIGIYTSGAKTLVGSFNVLGSFSRSTPGVQAVLGSG